MQAGRSYPMGFDTHKYIKALIHQGMKEPQAESIVQIVSDIPFVFQVPGSSAFGLQPQSRTLVYAPSTSPLVFLPGFLKCFGYSCDFDLSRLSTKDQLENVKMCVVALEEKMELRFAAIDSRFADIEGRFVAIDRSFAKVDERFVRLEEKVDANLGWMVGIGITVIGLMISIVLKLY